MGGTSFLGLKGISDLQISEKEIVSAGVAIQRKYQSLSHLKDRFPDAMLAKMQKVDLDRMSEIEKDIYKSILDYDHLKGSMLDEFITQELVIFDANYIFESLYVVLESVPTLKTIDFITYLITYYAPHDYAKDFIKLLLRLYDKYANPFFFHMTSGLKACFDGMIDTTLRHGSQGCFFHFYYQASNITQIWIEVSRPHLKLEQLKGLNPNIASKLLFNLWSDHFDNCIKVMNLHSCYNLWASLETVLPCAHSPGINSYFQNGLTYMQRLIPVNLEHSFTDNVGTNIKYSDKVCVSGQKFFSWVELDEIIFTENKITLKFPNQEQIDLIVSDQYTADQLRKTLAEITAKALYLRWYYCLCRNVPIHLDGITIRNSCLEYKGVSYSWQRISVNNDFKNFSSLTLTDMATNYDLAQFDFFRTPNACMLMPLRSTILRLHELKLNDFLSAFQMYNPQLLVPFYKSPKVREDTLKLKESLKKLNEKGISYDLNLPDL